MADSLIRDCGLTHRSFDAAAINRICNDSDVIAGLALGRASIDVTPILADPRNIAMLGMFGGAIFHRVAPRIFAAHDFFLPEGRGKWALAASREMLASMFAHYGARVIFAETPADNRACRMFNRLLGFSSEGLSVAPLFLGDDPRQIETFVLERP